MEHCASCGGNLRFDIPSQRMKCDYCGNPADPKEIESKEAKDDSCFDSTVYNCPNCFGEIIADDNEAAVFCPYCGDTTILQGRVTKIAKPKYIIPFKKTKEDCIQSYKRLLNRSIYAPNILRKEGVTDSFRGIYMPYWSYTEVLKRPVNFFGEERQGKFSEEIVYKYDCKFAIDAVYDGLSFDASKIFDDELSLAIAPFDAKSREEFAPGYMSGFYADTFDVDSKLYEEKASDIVSADLLSKIKKEDVYKKYHLKECNAKSTIKRTLHTDTVDAQIGYHPVWFMRYRFGNRMSYATINGQTGKAAGIIPASPIKYLLFSLLTAIPVFLLLNSISLMRPELAMLVANLLALLVFLIYDKECAVITWKEMVEGILSDEEDMMRELDLSSAHKISRVLLGLGAGAALICYLLSVFVTFMPKMVCGINVFLTATMIYLMVGSVFKIRKNNEMMKTRFLYLLLPLGGIFIVIMHIWNPIVDLYFYLAAVAQLVATGLTFIDLIYYHNIGATKPMPQFERTGGDDNAL